VTISACTGAKTSAGQAPERVEPAHRPGIRRATEIGAKTVGTPRTNGIDTMMPNSLPAVIVTYVSCDSDGELRCSRDLRPSSFFLRPRLVLMAPLLESGP
jgi:hypothetical protein